MLAAVGLALTVPSASARHRPVRARRPHSSGRVLVGIGDQHAEMFASPYFAALHTPVARLVVPWDAVAHPAQIEAVRTWVRAAEASRIQPLVAFGHAVGCYDAQGRVPDLAICRLPRVSDYLAAFLIFRREFPELGVYSPWNEANGRPEPTQHDPRRAAEFYNAVRSHCPHCTVVAADVLDQPGFVEYLKSFERYAHGHPRIWGLHNYIDTNTHTASRTRAMLAAVPGDLWLTETGGIVRFGPGYPYDPARAASATSYLFSLPRLYRRIRRVYVYHWVAVPPFVRWDSALTTPEQPRPAYYVVKAQTLRSPTRPLPWSSLPAQTPALRRAPHATGGCSRARRCPVTRSARRPGTRSPRRAGPRSPRRGRPR